MTQAPAAVFKIPTESPQPARGRASRARRAPAPQPKAPSRVLGIETRAATRGGGDVIELDLDALVASYWPEFAQAGKGAVTVRQLLSHQAGLPETSPRLSWDELLDHHRAAQRLAAARPCWHPGSAFGYHTVTIGNLASAR